MQLDLLNIVSWWFLFFIAGVTGIPLCFMVFRRFIDLGYAFSKTIGTLAIAYIAFLGAIFKFIPLERSNLFLISFLYLLVNTYLFVKKRREIILGVKKSFKIICAEEALFSAGFLFWSWVRAYQPDINGLEKLMDFGFINSILKSRFLPPIDMWFAGSPINYYWFGHFWVAIITKISGIPSSVTYNLMLATILGLGLISAFSLISTLVKSLNLKIDKRVYYIAGIISAMFLIFGGNFHTPFYVLKDGMNKYWYPDATRFIGYNPETNDKTIHEFPLYSFVVSDLHAHLINFPFVLLYIGLLWVLVSEMDKKQLFIKLLLSGFILGIMFMTSTWDFGNYLLLTGITLFIFQIKLRGIKKEVIIYTGIFIGTILVSGIITASPFILNFQSIAQGIKLVHSHTPLWQLAILWGFPGILTLIFIYIIINFNNQIKKADLFIVSLLITSWLLIAIPEIFYVKDIYAATHYRANTMFKLTYQAFVMFYLSSGYIIVRSLLLIKKPLSRLIVCTFYIIILSSILIYPYFAITSYYLDLKVYQTLLGDNWLKKVYPDEYSTVLWLSKIESQVTILEAPGDSYTDYDLISSYTGLPTVSGWFVHEWLWRGSPEIPQARVNDIYQIYLSSDENIVRGLVNKYKVKYVIVGTFEREKYPNLSELTIKKISKPVFSSGSTTIYQVN